MDGARHAGWSHDVGSPVPVHVRQDHVPGLSPRRQGRPKVKTSAAVSVENSYRPASGER